VPTNNPMKKEGRVWVQFDELDPFVLATCAGMTGLNDPRGDPTMIREPDPVNRRNSVIVDVVEGERPATTFNVVAKMRESYNWYKGITCPVNVQLHQGKCAPPNLYSASARGINITYCRRGTATADDLASVDNAGADAQINWTVPFSAAGIPLFIDWTAAFTRSSAGTLLCTTAFNDITALGESCGECGKAIGVDEIVWYCGDVASGSPAGSAEIWYTEDAGGTYQGTAADPFTALENSSSIVMYGVQDDYRVIVARGTADVWNPAEIAYSDDQGATWTNVNVGSTNGEYINKLFNIGAQIWAVGGKTSSGKIYFSKDGGVTWTQLYSGVQTLTDIKCRVDGYGICVGGSNVVLLSKKASESGGWAAVTGAAAGAGDGNTACAIKFNTQTVFYGNDAGEMYASQNWGDDWVSKPPQGITPTAIKWIGFYSDDEFGLVVSSIAGPSARVCRTSDGGATWTNATALNANITANVGLNAAYICDQNTFIVCGEAVSSVGYVAETSTTIQSAPV
jgi:hypothetical protein